MCQDKDGKPVSLFEIVELYHQPSRRIAFLHGTAQVSKVVNDEDPAAGLLCHLFDAADDCPFKVGIQKGVAVKRYPVQPFGKGVRLSVLVGIAELELLFREFKVQIKHVVSPGDTVGYLHGKDGFSHVGIRKEAGQFPLVPEAVPQRTGRGQLRCFEYGPVGGLYAHHADIFRHTVLHLGCPCQIAMDHADIVLVLFHGFYQLRWPGLRRWEEDMDSLSSSSDRGTGFLREDSSHLSSSSR